MFGVVIWSDIDEGKAVIWCEDHGDLAFCRQDSTTEFIQMDPGDLVQFELRLDRSQRIACNPRLVAEGVYDGLSGQLVSAQPDATATHAHPSRRGQERREARAKVVVIDDFRKPRDRARITEGVAASQ